MGNWGIADCAPKNEKIKAEFADFIHGLNSTGEINYIAYSQIFDEAMRLFDEIYKLGKSENMERSEKN